MEIFDCVGEEGCEAPYRLNYIENMTTQIYLFLYFLKQCLSTRSQDQDSKNERVHKLLTVYQY